MRTSDNAAGESAGIGSAQDSKPRPGYENPENLSIQTVTFVTAGIIREVDKEVEAAAEIGFEGNRARHC
jgi:hypothetical protein